MLDLRIVQILVILNVALFVRSASLGLELESVYIDPAEGENPELIRDKREPLRFRKGHLLHHHHSHSTGGNEEYHSGGGGGGNTATFAQSSAGTISTNGGHGNGASQSSSQSASYNFGPFSASFSASQSNANGGGGGFFDY